MTDTARVILWGRDIGAVTWLPERNLGVFQYTPEFADSAIEVAPLVMPLTDFPYEFPSLSFDTFRGLPGMLSDSLPDKFGNALIDAWLSQQGRESGTFTPVERLCYVGTRGMGAMEFKPAIKGSPTSARQIEIDSLVSLINRVLDDRVSVSGKLSGADDQRVIEDILRVGTSAGGARAKALLAWNAETGEFRSGQAPSSDGYGHWLMKFDGIHGKDKELADPQGFGRIEYAYFLMAQACGVDMAECRLFEEGGRAHFMTRRFDRTEAGDKMHMQSLCAMMHYDFNMAGAYGYEQALQTIRRLQLPMHDVDQQIRRAYLNILARNQDDHVKNIAFLMDRKGVWRLSPAYDVAFSFNPSGAWTSTHQMSMNGKRDNFAIDDLLTFAAVSGMKKIRAKKILTEISQAVANWLSFAKEAGISAKDTRRIGNAHRHDLFV